MNEGWIERVGALIQSYWTLCYSVSFAMGICFVATGVISFSRRRNDGGGISGSISGILAGVCCVNLPWWISLWSSTVTGRAAEGNPLAYIGSSASSYAGAALIEKLVAAIGLYGVIRGLYLLRESAYDRRLVGPGITHSVAGIFAINVTVVARMLMPYVPATMQQLLAIFS